ncbi:MULTISPECIES: Mu transposase C-terminal domain-containing protein [Achromobacter]|uniref:Mu transposase C-terminal domain-containing protein n=1 Tax=Achromobacter TaxID=222 RepID=UPI00067BE8E0|nr:MULTISPECIES: Mu transposase C-terminal domain-containing protein [Achromobacter]MCD0501246.1 DDE-type integrase/transposase/recombinase [Achromobacter sp. MY14]
MKTYSLQVGLIVQKGARQLTFVRDLGGNRVQFEDIHTRAISTFKAKALIRQIDEGRILVISTTGVVPTLSPAQQPAVVKEMPLLVGELTDKQAATIEGRENYVRAALRMGVSAGSRREIEKILPKLNARFGVEKGPSASTLMRWLKAFIASGRNVMSLMSGNTVRQTPQRLDEADTRLAQDAIDRHYLVLRGKSLAATYVRYSNVARQAREAGGEDSVQVVSLSTFHRLLKSRDQSEIDRKRKGPAATAHKWRQATGGIYATRPLERVEMDHTELDLYVIDDQRGIPLGRPTVTVIIDTYTKYILALYLSFEGESLGRVCQSLRLALRPKDDLTTAAMARNEWLTPGIFETLVVDNGLAFQSPQLRRIAWALGCDLEYSAVRKPWFKPNVERSLGTMMTDLPREGCPPKARDLIDREDPRITACVMFSELCSCLVRWAVDLYPFQISERSLTPPIDRLREGMENMPPPTFVTGLDSLDLLTGLQRELTVAHHGVEMNYLHYRSPELAELTRAQRSPRFKTLIKYDPNDLGSIWVRNPETLGWLRVPCMVPEYADGLTLKQHEIIRSLTKDKLRRMGRYEEWQRAQQEFAEMVDNAVSRGKRLIRDMKKFAQLQGLSSLKPRASLALTTRPAPERASKLVADEELSFKADDIPNFQPFNSNGFNLGENRDDL